MSKNGSKSLTIASQGAQTPGTYRDYAPELKAAVIEAIYNNGGNTLATAKLFNIPQTTVYEWWKHSERFNEIRKPSALNLADKLEFIANSQADSLATDDLAKVAHIDKARAMAVVIDKMQLLRGDPTQITESTSDTLSALASLLKEIRESARLKAQLANSLSTE